MHSFREFDCVRSVGGTEVMRQVDCLYCPEQHAGACGSLSVHRGAVRPGDRDSTLGPPLGAT
jgi:hypothetical protein